MNEFSLLLERLYFTNSTKTKTAVIHQYLRETSDPDRGWAIAAIAGTLNFDLFKRAMIKQLILERVDETLFALSYDYVGEMSETVAHMWPQPSDMISKEPLPTLSEVVGYFKSANKQQVKEYLVDLLNRMTPAQRWALVKLGTRGLRIGVSARLIKRILAEYGHKEVAEIEQLWHGLEPPYVELLDWLEARSPKPDVSDRVTFHPVMLAHPLDENKLFESKSEAKSATTLALADWQVEWKYDGIRVQLVSSTHGKALFSRTGDDISHSFPDLIDSIDFYGVYDGELLIIKDGIIGSFNDLQQRLNKKRPSKKLQQQAPAGMMIYDVLKLEQTLVTQKPLCKRRELLANWFAEVKTPRLMLSETLQAEDSNALKQLREQATDGNKNAIEGLMLKRKDSFYIAGRPANQWLKWKRQPFVIDAVMMYAQRGHGKRSSYYSDYTFGVWQDDMLVPVGKAYSGFTDEELKELDRWVRRNTIGRFGPVKEVEKALVLEVAFDSAHYSKRHKSGIALRFPRINRIRWDKPASECDTVASVASLIT